jgi:hypothetical protein
MIDRRRLVGHAYWITGLAMVVTGLVLFWRDELDGISIVLAVAGGAVIGTGLARLFSPRSRRTGGLPG